jgi:hypothetical protein
MRTFSVDIRGRCVVLPVHMNAADQFLRQIYDNPDFGYGSISKQRIDDRQQTLDRIEDILGFIVSRPGLLRFLKHTPVFDRFAIETVMNVPREVSGALINDLWDMKAVTYDEGKLKLDPMILNRIREI